MHDRPDLSACVDTLPGGCFGSLGEEDPARQPYLVVLAVCDDRREPSSRHLLTQIDEVRFGRGPRSATRSVDGATRVLEIRIPDGWMSSHHGRLLRGPAGWVLDDPRSKNGSMVNGQTTRQTMIGDGALIELGHTFLLFCDQPLEDGAKDDVVDGGAFVAVNCGALPPSLLESELICSAGSRGSRSRCRRSRAAPTSACCCARCSPASPVRASCGSPRPRCACCSPTAGRSTSARSTRPC